ncbi:MAG: GtrA family protein [Steroidobacteraceae bacterium]
MTQSDRVQLLPTGAGPLPLVHKFGRFLLVGGLCTILQYALLILFVEEVHLSPTAASTIGYVASSLVNYLLNYSFTFKSTAEHRRSMPRFVVIALCGVALNAAVTFVGTAVLGLHYLLAQVIATCLTLGWNFVANLRWTF